MKKLCVYRIFPNGTKTLFWEAPFKTDEELVKSIMDYSARGFYCKVVPFQGEA